MGVNGGPQVTPRGDRKSRRRSQRSRPSFVAYRAATTLAARGEVPQRVIQREGRWKSPESSKVYTRNNPEDASIVSRKLAETAKIGERQPGHGSVWGRNTWHRNDLGVGVCQWFTTIGGLGRSRLRVIEPRPVAGGGELFVTGIMLGNEKLQPVPRFSYRASRAPPPPTSQIVIIT